MNQVDKARVFREGRRRLRDWLPAARAAEAEKPINRREISDWLEKAEEQGIDPI